MRIHRFVLPGLVLPSLLLCLVAAAPALAASNETEVRSEEHTSELQSQSNLVCRLLLEKKNFLELKKQQAEWMTPSTPSIGHIFALQSKLDEIFEEGLPVRFDRHAKTNALVHD